MKSYGFEHPAVLALILLVPLYYFFRSKGIFSRYAVFLTMADWNGTAFVWKNAPSRAAVFLSKIFVALAFVFAVVSLAGPVVKRQEKVFTSRGMDILFVLDTSPSMAAKDIARSGGPGGIFNSRFDSAKEIILNLAQKHPGQMGIVAFASEAVMSVPVTSDMDFFSRRLEEIKLGALGNGSGIGTGLALAVYHLASNAKDAHHNKCVVLLTDGENNRGAIHPLTAARLAQEYGITFYIAGLGTKGRVPLEYIDPATGTTYSGFFDSHFDETSLKNLAAEGGGLYFAVTTLRGLEMSLEAISAREQTNRTWYYRADIEPFHGTVSAAFACAVFAWLIKRILLKEIL
jgi:Ca-activated chloride channel family protein